MPYRFAYRLLAVVASRASARHHSHVFECCRRPGRVEMAIAARSIGRYVYARFCHCPHAVSRYVATCTIPWCSLEHVLDMTCAALGQSVGASKIKPCFDMVERRLCPSRMNHGQQWQQKHHSNPARRTQDLKQMNYSRHFIFAVHFAAPFKEGVAFSNS